ncbi:MAG: hypothetical protein OEM32_00920 [Acidimicrobiia bacterium]|nr:hypothetical protein [Acidimicrobiia bacterium]
MTGLPSGHAWATRLLNAMERRSGPLARSREWLVVAEWPSFSAKFALVESGSDRVALKLGSNWNGERAAFVADECERVRRIVESIEGGGVTMPAVYGVLADPPALAIAYVEGQLLFESLPALSDDEIITFMRKSGQAIGAYHRAQPASAAGSPAPFSEADLPGLARWAGVSRSTTRTMAPSLHNARRYQFSPNDLLIDNDGNIVLLDPPHFSKYDYVHRDVATAFMEMHKNLIGARRPTGADDTRRMYLAREAFLAGYADTGPTSMGSEDHLAIELFVLSRVLGVAWGRIKSGQLRAGFQTLGWAFWQRGRIRAKRDLE